ncbi:uncharacterized protein LOC144543551 isoform X1 [Centroberyx gerrardi]
MLCSRCVLPFLAFYLLLEETSAFVLPNRFRKRRDVSWLDQELFPRLPERSERGDLSVGDAGETGRETGRETGQETGRGPDGRPSQSAAFLTPLEHLSHHSHRKNNEKRWRVAPLDSIGSSLLSSYRNRKDEPDVDWEDYSE